MSKELSEEDKRALAARAQAVRTLQEVQLLLNSIERAKNDVLAANSKATVEVVAAFDALAGGVRVRYLGSFSQPQPESAEVAVPQMEPPTAEAVPAQEESGVGVDPTIARAPSPIVEESPPEKSAAREAAEKKVPANLAARLEGAKWYKVPNAPYVVRNMDMVDADIKTFFLALLGDKTETEQFTYGNSKYQIVKAADGGVWIRRWLSAAPAKSSTTKA